MSVFESPKLRSFLLGSVALWATYLAFLVWGYYTGHADVRRHHLESRWLILCGLMLVALVATRRRDDAATGSAIVSGLTPVRGRELATAITVSIVLAFAFYGRTLTDGMLSDDFVLAERVRLHHYFVNTGSAFFRPLPLLLWSLVAACTAVPDVWLHGVNISLHGLNGALVFVLALRWGCSRPMAVGAALLFLVFPGHIEAVAWISGIQDVLMATGTLLFVLSMSAVQQTWWTRIGSVLALVAALLSKETAVAAVGLAGLTMLQRRETSTRRHWQWWGVASGLAVAFLAWRVVEVPEATGIIPSLTPFGIKDFAAKPLSALGSPWSAADLLASAFVGVLAAWSLLALALRAATDSSPRRVAFQAVCLLAWIMFSVAPLGRYFFVAPDLLGGRYLYLPAVGWAILLIRLADARFARGSLRAAVSLASLLVLGALYGWGTVRHLRPWQEAGLVRDHLLAQIREHTARTACERIAVDRIPKSVEGAHVFLNGLPEAVAMESGSRVRVEIPGADVPEPCHIRPLTP